MKTSKTVTWLTGLLLVLGTAGIALAQVSPNFDLSWHLLSGGGGARSSANYRVDDSLGQWAGTSSLSANYALDPGFWYGAAPAPNACLVPLENVSINGPTTGYIDTVYNLTAAVDPTDASLPVSYAWSTDGLVGGQGTSSGAYSWSTTGAKTVTVQATNCGGTADDTHTITINPPAPAGDSYEEDDICGSASTIAVGGAPQTHTFHDAGDQDWIKFTAQANKTYIVETSNVGADHDASLFLYGSCDDPSLKSEDNAFAQTLRLEWDNATAGTYYLKLQQHDATVHGAQTNYDISVSVDSTPPSAPTSPRSAALDGGLAVQWQRPAELDVVRYRICWKPDTSTGGGTVCAGKEDVEGGDTTYYELTGLTNGTRYYLTIRALDFSGNLGAWSPEISNVPEPPEETTAPVVTVSQPTATGVHTTSLAALMISGSAQDSGNNLSRVKVRNVTSGSEAWDYSLSGGSGAFYAGNISLLPGDNDVEITVYDDAGNTGSDSLTIHRLGASLGAVIIVAGRKNEVDGLQTNIDNVANRAYQVFQGAGFDDDHIYYLAPTPQDPDGDGVYDEVDDSATPANLQYAIQTWASQSGRAGPGQPLYLYMMDHGAIEYFCVDNCETSGQVTSQELNAWLNNLETATGADQVNVIIEACHSGSFIDYNGVPDSLSKAGRVLITSTNRENFAYASPKGAYFSDAFFSCLEASNDLKTCYGQAKAAVAATSHTQTPWLDDNGDGASNPSTDGTIAEDRYVARFFGALVPEITEAAVAVERGTGTLTAQVERGAEEIELVWAAVYGPTFEEPDSTTMESGVPLVRLEADREVEGLYTGSYPAGFTSVGDYRVVFYAQDGSGTSAEPQLQRVTVASQTVYLPVLFKFGGQ